MSIYVLADSASDLPYALEEQHPLRIIPLKVETITGSYRDGIDIDAPTLYSLLDTEIPKTSLPNGEEVLEIIRTLPEDAKILGITVSSGLSGTINSFRYAKEALPERKMAVIDTKNIAIGEGFLSLYALDLIAEGLPFEEIVPKVEAAVSRSKIFYTLETLKYLRAGGRIGKVSGFIGDLLDIKPIISCNDDGIYYTVIKARGRKKAIREIVKRVSAMVEGHTYYLALCHGNVPEEAESIKEEIRPLIEGAKEFYMNQITPVLGVHTGPGLLGLGAFLLD